MLYFKENKERKVEKHLIEDYNAIRGNYEGDPLFATFDTEGNLIMIDELCRFWNFGDERVGEYWEDTLINADYLLEDWTDLEFLKDFDMTIERKK